MAVGRSPGRASPDGQVSPLGTCIPPGKVCPGGRVCLPDIATRTFDARAVPRKDRSGSVSQAGRRMHRRPSWGNADGGMETTLILAAIAVFTLSCIVVMAMMARARRPELRMAREEDLMEDLMEEDEETLMRSLQTPRTSPIDRSATILPIEPQPDVRRLPPGDGTR